MKNNILFKLVNKGDSELIQIATDAENQLKMVQIEHENCATQLSISVEKIDFFERNGIFEIKT